MRSGLHSGLSRVACALALALASCVAWAVATPEELAVRFQAEVDRRLEVPAAETQRYGRLAEDAAAGAGVALGQEYLVVVDRNPRVQALLLLWRSDAGDYRLVGATPVSTGLPGTYDHFETPLGVFAHSLANPDFRAEGTLNENGIRGYGAKGMRVYDFGWQQVPKGWGDGKPIDMRLQMHATDADVLEPRLGSARSQGCVRIPGTLNALLDRYGVLDADYDRALQEGQKLWVLRADREPVSDAGRWMIVVDSGRGERPAWSRPSAPRRAKATATTAATATGTATATATGTATGTPRR